MIAIMPVVRSVLAPLISIVLLMLSNGFFVSFTSLRLSTLGYDEWIVGVVNSAYYAGMLVGAARAEWVIRRVGHIRAYAAFAAISTGCLMAQALFPSPLIWTVLRFTAGFCLAVFYIVVESWFLAKSSERTRGLILALYMFALYVSQGVSQSILTLINLDSMEPFCYATLLAALSALPLTWTKTASPPVHEESEYSILSLVKQSPFGCSGCFFSGIILSGIYSFAPLFARHLDLSVAGVMTTIIIGGVALQWPIGHLSDLYDRRKVLFCVALATCVPAILIVFFHSNATLLYPLLFIQGGVAFTLYPLGITQACDRLQPEELTTATGMLLLIYGIGAVLGPMVAPIFIDSLPPYGLFPFIAIASLALSGIGIYSLSSSAAVPIDDQGHFVALPSHTAAVAYELDPRQSTDY